MSYCNIVETSTFKTKLGKMIKKQKHENMGIIHNKDKYLHSRRLTRSLNVLNVYQINIFIVLRFMYKAKHDTVLSIYLNV